MGYERHAEPFDERGFETRLRAIQAETKGIYGPPSALVHALTKAAYLTQQDLAPVFAFSPHGEASEPQVLLQFELFYFFAHLALRSAAAVGTSESRIRALHAYTGTWLASAAVDAFFVHWPDDLKRGIANEFYDKLNTAQAEYAECAEVYSNSDPLATNTLFGLFAQNAASLWERQDDARTRALVARTTMRAYQGIPLPALVAEAAEVIESVDIEFVQQFLGWRLTSA